MNWYAMLDTEEIKPLGTHADISYADEVAPSNTHWLFNEDSLRRFMLRAIAVLPPAPEAA